MRGQRGFTYIGLMILVVILGIGLAGAGVLWRTESQRDREAELLFDGQQVVHAITIFYERTPVGQRPRFPATLQELLEDKRYPVPQRDLRRIYLDPMTGKPEWGIVRAPDGGVLGVYSLSQDVPLKRAGFPPPYEDFASAATYRDWRFVYVPPGQVDN